MDMDTIVTIQPIVALIAGLIILFVPRVLSFVVAAYLIFIGLTGLYPNLFNG